MRYRSAAMAVMLIAAVVVIGALAPVQARRILATSDPNEALAGALEPGEMLILVGEDGSAEVLVDGVVCGEWEAPLQDVLDEAYALRIFGSLDELISEKADRTTANLTDIIVVFEPGVATRVVDQYQQVFRRYKAFYCQSCDCCTPSRGYSCCPNKLDAYFLYDWGAASSVAVDFADRVHSAKARSVTTIEAVVVADQSLRDLEVGESEEGGFSLSDWVGGLFGKKADEEPSLLRWLREELPSSQVHSLDLQTSADGAVQVVPDQEAWSLCPTSIVFAVAVYEESGTAPADRKAAIEAAVLRAIAERQEDMVVMLFLVPDPVSATLASGLSAEGLAAVSKGVVFAPASEQGADLLKESLDTLKEVLAEYGTATVEHLTDRLRPLGLIAFVR